METNYKAYLQHITTFIFDVDGVLTDGTVMITSDGQMLRSMTVRDGYAIKIAIDKGYRIGVISGGTNPGVASRLKGLGVTDVYLGEQHKPERLLSYLSENGIAAKNVLYMGDDIPDREAMQSVGLPCCPNDAVSEIKEICTYISHKNGGRGCVRDVIEQVLKVQGNWIKSKGATLH